MTKFYYNALKNNKEIINGEIEAVDLRDARVKIRELGYLPTKIEKPENFPCGNFVEDSAQINYLSLREKIFFTNELHILFASGIPVIEALNLMETNTSNRKLKLIADNIREGIENGQTFSQAINKYSKIFGPVYIGLVLAGECSGELDKTLERMTVLLRQQEELKDKIIKSMTYPCFLIVLMIGLMTLMPFILSKFLEVITNSGGELPLLAKSLLCFSSFMVRYWWLCLIAVAGGIYALNTAFGTSEFKKKWDNFILKVPVISEFIQYINLSDFIAVLHVSYEAGVPILECLNLAGSTVKNNVIKEQINSAADYVKTGNGLSDAFARYNVVPGALLTMISTGEKSGQLGKMLKNASNVIDKKLDMIISTMARLIEPTMIVIMGIVVGIFVIAFYQAYYGMLGTLF